MAWLHRSLLCLTLTALLAGCDSPKADPGSSDTEIEGTSGTDSDATDTDRGEPTDGSGANPGGGCVEGYAFVDSEADCEEDVYCYAWGNGWCTGACPGDLELGWGPDPFCTSAGCAEGEIVRSAGEACTDAPGVECVAGHHAIWTCEGCMPGWTHDEENSTPEAVACLALCAEGHAFVLTQDECLADAGCYELVDDGGYCTGDCPEGQTLEIPDDGSLPTCVDVRFAR